MTSFGWNRKQPGADAPEAGKPATCDIDRISRYFYNNAGEEQVCQTIDAETASDLDLNAVFAEIDRTTSAIGRQVFYARLRTLRGEKECKAFGERVAWFAGRSETAERCRKGLRRIEDEAGYELQGLIFDTPARVRHVPWIAAASAASVLSLLGGLFVHPPLLLLFAALFTCNLWFHYSNKIHILRYTLAVGQLHRTLRVARDLAHEKVPGTELMPGVLHEIARIRRRSRIVGHQGDNGNEFAALGFFVLELVKIAFNIEVLLFHRFVKEIPARREAIHTLIRYVGETDAALAVLQLRETQPTCLPTFTDRKYLAAEEVRHPLIADCVPNTLRLDGSGLLLTGSNMSGKTSFIRTLALNALLAETIDTCFAGTWTAPYLRIFSTIRITDDVSQGASYYLQEVLAVKRQLDAAEGQTPCLFALDELFKGTNTPERIAAGKAVLARLNRGPHLVLCATHDIELATLLRKDGYELHHFREEVVDGRLSFDYRLHAGALTTSNAIRILELYGYPPEVIAEARALQRQRTARDIGEPD